MDVSVATTILSERSAALMEQYFGKDKDGNVDKQKVEAAKFVKLAVGDLQVFGHRILQM